MPQDKPLVQRISERIVAAISHPNRELGRWGRFLWFQVRLGYICMRQLRRDRFNHVAAGLAFRTIFGLVPLLVMAGFIAQFFVEKDQVTLAVQQFLTRQTNAGSIPLPVRRGGGRRGRDRALEADTRADTAPDQSGDDDSSRPRLRPGDRGRFREREPIDPTESDYTVADFIEGFMQSIYGRLQRKGIGVTGLLLLAYAAIALLNHIERAFNSIYHVSDRRSLWRRVTGFWTILTLMPILMGMAMYAGSSLRDMLSIGGGAAWWAWLTSQAWSLLVTWGFLMVIYLWLPNTRVALRSAAFGALTAAIPWLIAKAGFGIYVEHAVVRLSLFGAIGAVLLFFLWIYICWLVVLFGLEVTYVMQHMAGLEMKEVARSRRGGMMLDRGWLFRVAAAFASSFSRGEGPLAPHTLADRYRLPHDTIAALAEHLAEHGILVPVVATHRETRYQLNRPPEGIPLTQLAGAADELDPGYARPGADTPVERLIAELAHGRDAALGERTLADLVE